MVAVLGLICGSFLNVCISRIPEERSIFFPPSHCPKCKKRIKPYDLIPVFSWLILRGRCRACREPISPRYPVVEAITSGSFLLISLKTGLSIDLLLLAILAALLITIAFIDIETMMIPDFLLWIGIADGLLYSFLNGNIELSLIGICAGFIVMLFLSKAAFFVFKKEALGDGDIKLMVMIGAFIGPEKIFLCLAGGSILGAVAGGMLVLFKKLKIDDYVPFAPFLALSAFVLILI